MSPQNLRLALIAPLVSPIAEPFTGGAQAFLHDFTLELAKRGHSVTLFAATGSKIEPRNAAEAECMPRIELVEIPVLPGELKPTDFNQPDFFNRTDPQLYRQFELFQGIFREINQLPHRYHLAHAMAYDYPVFALSPLSAIPAVHTLHLGSIDPHITRLLHQLYQQSGYCNAVTVSQACANTFNLPNSPLAFDRVIYNGIDIAGLSFGNTPDDFLLFAGRLTPEKGVDLAIEIATRANRRLVIAGSIYDEGYFEQEIKPQLAANPDLQYVGLLSRPRLYELMSRAHATVFTSRWEEPYGLVIAESLAAGTPVVAWRRGAAPEIIEDGVSGFLVDFGDVATAIERVQQVASLNRTDCRTRIEQHFGIETMMQNYINYYHEVIARWPVPLKEK